jgi:hypothetical protein
MHPTLAEPTTKEEWRAYINAVSPSPPQLPSHTDYQALAPAARRRLDRLRHQHHSALVIIRTTRMQQLHHVIERRVHANAAQPAGARRSIVIDGPPTVGKSTLVKLFGLDLERGLRTEYPERFAPGYHVDGIMIDYTPVVYLSIPAQATPKDLSAALADFLGQPYRPRATKTEITNIALNAMKRCGVALIIVDDVHFLDLSAKEGKLANDHLKDIANKCPVTFVFTGHDLEHSGLFLEGLADAERATQTSGRNALHRLDKFKITTEAEQREWAGTIMTMEDSLLLYRHKPGTLLKHYRYLHDRTDGSICALADLIRESAIEAVMTGEEAITKKLMDTIIISKQAEAAYRRKLKLRTSKQRTSTAEPEPAPAPAAAAS